jgi:hypothetical protein
MLCFEDRSRSGPEGVKTMEGGRKKERRSYDASTSAVLQN